MFKSKYFSFNGINSRSKNISIVSVGENGNNNQFGIRQSAESQDGIGDTEIHKGTKREAPSLDITLCKLDRENNLLSFSQKEKDFICRWFFKREYKPFISEDNRSKVYYVIFTEGDSFFNGLNQGYINLKMQLSSPYAYSTIIKDTWRVSNYKEIDIYNNSNIECELYPDIEIELLEDTNMVEIYNQMTGSRTILNNLQPKEYIYIYGDELRDIVSKVDEKRNLFPNFNQQWLKLVYGRNKIIVKAKACNIRIINQYPLALI
ncbi:MAG: phage tail family protein [Clostridium sp.]